MSLVFMDLTALLSASCAGNHNRQPPALSEVGLDARSRVSLTVQAQYLEWTDQ
jgi:hypothetical protein